MTVSSVCLLFCLHLGIVIGQLNSTRDTLAERKLQGPLLALEVPLFLGIFGAGTAVAEGGAVAVPEGQVDASVLLRMLGAGTIVAKTEMGTHGRLLSAADNALTVSSLAGTMVSFVEDALFPVEADAHALADAIGVSALTDVGTAITGAIADSALDICKGVVADLGDLLSRGKLDATEHASPQAKQLVQHGGKILQKGEVQKGAAAGAANNVQESSEKTAAFLRWATQGMTNGFLGNGTKRAMKSLMAKASSARVSRSQAGGGGSARVSKSQAGGGGCCFYAKDPNDYCGSCPYLDTSSYNAVQSHCEQSKGHWCPGNARLYEQVAEPPSAALNSASRHTAKVVGIASLFSVAALFMASHRRRNSMYQEHTALENIEGYA